MRVVDFYCGAGGMSAGAILAGCTVTHGIDMDSSVIDEYAASCMQSARVSPQGVREKEYAYMLLHDFKLFVRLLALL